MDELHEPWDIAYYSENRSSTSTASATTAAPYFPENKAVNWPVRVVKRIYSITAKER